jgi:3-oxoacyl-[acyl-carrier-protein] synthase-1
VDTYASSTSIAIIGLGVRCAAGLTAPAAAAAVRAGISRLREHPYMLDKVGERFIVAAEPTLDPKVQGPERFTHLAAPALKEAVAPLADRDISMQSLHTLVGTPDPRPGLPAGIEDGLGRLVASVANSKTSQRLTFLGNGHAAGLLAIKRARDILQAGMSRFCVAGGVDSYLTADSLEWMDQQKILKSSANRNGFPPGEAAGFCLLTTGAIASELSLPVLGWLETLGAAREESPIRTKTICVGRGLSDAIQQATAPLRLPDERIDESICDLNGEPYRSEEFAFTVLRTQMAFVDFTRVVTPADCWGDIGAASGPLFANLAVAAAQRGYAKGPRTLIWASSERGDRAAAIIYAPPRRPRGDA